jgi:hypothetical protein
LGEKLLSGQRLGVLVRASFVYLVYFLGYVLWGDEPADGIKKGDGYIMVTAEEHQEHADGGRKEEQAVFCEDVRIKHPTAVFVANFVLGLLVVAIKRGKVDIG